MVFLSGEGWRVENKTELDFIPNSLFFKIKYLKLKPNVKFHNCLFWTQASTCFYTLKIPQFEKLDRKKVCHNINNGSEEMSDWFMLFMAYQSFWNEYLLLLLSTYLRKVLNVLICK